MRRATERTAFASIMAMLLIGVVAAVVATVAAGVAADGRRTRRVADEAQVRQLLLAGIDAAVARAGDPDGRVEAAVPTGTMTLTFEPASDGTRTVEVDASVGVSVGGEVVRLRRGGDGWVVDSVGLR